MNSILLLITVPLLLLLSVPTTTTTSGCELPSTTNNNAPFLQHIHPTKEDDNDHEILFQDPTIHNIEKLYASIPSPEKARENLRHYTLNDHMAGTKSDFELAEWTRDQLFRQGNVDDAWIESFPALVSYPSLKPKEQARIYSVGSKNKITWEAKLSEDLADESSFNTLLRNRTFNGYSPAGKVRGKIVYANFGLVEDFAALVTHGISVKGCIVIMRYGKCFRGLKVWNAQRAGAIGAIIYSDPQQDGFVIGNVYPSGPWRSASSVQRGSVQFDSLCSGDPMRVATGNNSKHVCGYSYQDLIPSIPVLPISSQDATTLLNSIVSSGKNDTLPNWIGAIPNVVYRLGKSNIEFNMETYNSYEIAKIPNVIAIYKSKYYGTELDRPIVIGNHRDAWVFGAVDPNSGSSVLLEVARGLGQLKRQLGWKPKRSIILASWSGEELGLIGSTAWGEKHGKTTLKHCIAYLNVDIGVAGNKWQVAATSSLAPLIRSVLKSVPDPETGREISKSWEHVIPALGSGSDYTVFIHHLGIVSADVRFSPSVGMGSNSGVQYGTYHSIYDDYEWMIKFGDPTFKYHQTQAIILGKLALRIADSVIVPFSHIEQARTVLQYINSVKSMLSNKIAFYTLKAAGLTYLKAAIDLQKEMISSKTTPLSDDELKHLNDRIAFAERKFLNHRGLPRRKWFKHVLQAPGLYTGYAPDILPAIVQSFKDDSNPQQANIEAFLIANQIFDVARFISGGSNHSSHDSHDSHVDDDDGDSDIVMIGEEEEEAEEEIIINRKKSSVLESFVGDGSNNVDNVLMKAVY
jgi:N-acetylated-alpha-linked acidic dipeptidase